MRKLIGIILLIVFISPSLLFARGFSRGSGFNEGDLDMGNYSIDGSSTNGLRFDSDNDGTNEFTMNASGTFTIGAFTLPATDGSGSQVLTTLKSQNNTLKVVFERNC